MKIFKDGMIKDKYEVIVIGAGIGGLTAAALLAKKGIDTLVVEHHYVPGGCCSSIRRQDTTMDVGAAVFYGFGEDGYNNHQFVMNELEEEIDMIDRESIYHMHFSGKEIIYWKDFDRFFKEIVALFPNQKKELADFYDYIFDFYKSTILKDDSIVAPTEKPLQREGEKEEKDPEAIKKLLHMFSSNAEDIIKKFFDDEVLIAYFDMLARTFSYCMANETPALATATMFADNHIGGAYYPAGSPQMLPNKMEKAIERFGGQILYRHMVDEILMSDGSAYGIRLSDGTEIMAEKVIANATIWNLYGKLVRAEHIKPERMEWAQKMVPTNSNLMLYISVDKKAVPDWAHPMEIFIEDMYDKAGHGFTVYIPSLLDSSICPEGTHAITISKVSELKWPAPSDPDYQADAYKKMKSEEADKVLDVVEKYMPDFKKYIRHIEIATPTTLERFTLKNWGNLGGPRQFIGQDMFNRLHAQSEWGNIFICGDSTTLGLGVLPSTTSGVGAANMVLRDMEREEYLPREFSKKYINLLKKNNRVPLPDLSDPITEDSAKRIATECQLCEKPGCVEACPASVDSLNFLRRIEAGNFAGAARSIREMNPFGEICGYICPSEKLCEKNCNRLDFSDHHVRISDLQAWVCGHVRKDEGWTKDLPEPNGYKIAVVGAGPAGLTCAHFLARLGYMVDILDRSERAGGMLNDAIPNYRIPENVINREIEGLTIPGMNFLYGKSLGKDIEIKNLERDYDSVFLAPGLGSGKKLAIDGIGNMNSTDALSFLRLYKQEEEIIVSKKVIVIGGGSVAADAAITAKSAGAEDVTLVCLENPEEMPALSSEIEEMKEKGIIVMNSWGPDKIVDYSRVSFIACTSVFDSNGTFAPSFEKSKTMEVECDQIIVAIGQELDSGLAEYFKEVFGTEGLLEVDTETMQVKGYSNIFAGGDIVRGAGTVVEAVSDGRRAAAGIDSKIRTSAHS